MPRAQSFIAYELATGKAVFETWNPSVAAKINRARYGVVTAHEWLSAFNAAIALARGLTA